MNLCLFPYTLVLFQVSKDQNALDTNIPNQIASFVFTTIQLLGIIAVMSQAAWQFFFVFIPVIIVSICYQVFI